MKTAGSYIQRPLKFETLKQIDKSSLLYNVIASVVKLLQRCRGKGYIKPLKYSEGKDAFIQLSFQAYANRQKRQ